MNERVGPTDYRVAVGDSTKVYHINMLKKYFAPSDECKDSRDRVREGKGEPEVIAATVLEEGPEDELQMSLPGGMEEHQKRLRRYTSVMNWTLSSRSSSGSCCKSLKTSFQTVQG